MAIGVSGGVGATLVDASRSDPRCASVIALSRSFVPALDLTSPARIAQAAASVAGQGPFHLINNA
ncbi:hypothetical protein P5704_020835 [Pseudomonas sp. FeN3W]|uniref:Short chain dehydrogenase/reductase family oxidoreductase n=1 Tax=Stutzerimonas stutzeri NF13 TaxID=1212548 RepID=M2UN31_STUST|nr:hypothetical protein [Stutzerimonas stutzeri]EMD99994.1 short chain dehydrogenase/reductase family oxidoreductase [Stutzerimonas stutzeri NF13]MCQ4290020.1 hypothetical protein [Stutzerimonas stutzeri]WOF78429.1 hypothetical protein P5704_020835 [Pseudomonas sp. FeN3W]